MPLKTVRVRASPASRVSLSSLVEPFDLLAGDDEGDAQVELGEVVDRDRRRDRFAARQRQRDRVGAGDRGRGDRCRRCRRRRRRRRVEQGIELLRVDALHQVLVRRDPRRHGVDVVPGEVAVAAEQLARDAAGERRQDRREQDREHLEPVQRARADLLQLGAARRILGEQPRLRGIELAVDAVGDRHDLAQRLADSRAS
jgi:hypothetical protein